MKKLLFLILTALLVLSLAGCTENSENIGNFPGPPQTLTITVVSVDHDAEEASVVLESKWFGDMQGDVVRMRMNREYSAPLAVGDVVEISSVYDLFDGLQGYVKLQTYRLSDDVAKQGYFYAGCVYVERDYFLSQGGTTVPGHTVRLRRIGTVKTAGSNVYGQCEVSKWRGITAVATGSIHTLGLKADGTVLAAGGDFHGQCGVSEWTDIVAIAAGGQHSVGLRADGTVVAVGLDNHGQCDVSDWTDIVEISAGRTSTTGIKADGTVLTTGK